MNWHSRSPRALTWTACLFAVFALAVPTDSGTKRLWPGAHFTEQDRDAAIERGLQFIYRMASNPEYFARLGHDMIFCFYTISNTAKNPKLREMARRMGEERARQWRHDNPDPPIGDPDDLYVFVLGEQTAEKFLGPSPQVKARVQAEAESFSAIDFLRFDPQREPPPSDIPERCPKCNYQNPRGATVCQKCQTALTFRSRYDVWLDALVASYAGDTYGVKLGATYPEVVQWVSRMRPYATPKDEQELDSVTYALTHLVYTLNDYNKYRVSPTWLPQEFRFLRTSISEAERYEDPEMLGEFMDTLRAFGEDESAPEIRAGMNYLLSKQNPDGSWGNPDETDIYARYHTTWTVIDGLRQYSYAGVRLRVPNLMPLLAAGKHSFTAQRKTKAAH